MNGETWSGGDARHRVDPATTISTDQRLRQVVYVVDDDDDCRASILKLIESLGYEALGFESAEQFLQFDGSDREIVAACLIVDFRLTGMSGLELQEALQQRGRKMPLVLMSGVAPFATAAEAVRRGVVSLLEKPIRGGPLRSVLQNAFSSMTVVSAARPDQAHLEKMRLVQRLSPREREVARMVAEGLSNRQIATELHLSEKTVEKYRSNCVRKLLAKNSTDMVRTIVMAEMHGLN